MTNEMGDPGSEASPDEVEEVKEIVDEAASGATSRATPITHLNQPMSPDATGAAGELTKFLWRTPFLDLHERAGEPGLHPRRLTVCLVLDMLTRGIAILLLFSIILFVALKTLDPIPWPWK